MDMRWFDRTFSFGVPEELFPNVVERLRGVPGRIEEKVRGLSPAALTRRESDRWSIQEHIGHLLDLDELHTARLNDYLQGAEVLRAADLQNKKTHEAGYNRRNIEDLLREFRRGRQELVDRLDGWDKRKASLSALHPRLQQPMRVIDMALFAAEHDDHHLTRMTELRLLFSATS